jgi:hypothetical protein
MAAVRVFKTLTAAVFFSALPMLAVTQQAQTPPTVIIAEPYVPVSSQWRGDLLAFVGKRLAVEELGSNDFNEVFHARYQVLQVIYGDYPDAAIEFEAEDHYGFPKFAEYETALLYVVRLDGKYYHEQYLFDDVYPTTDGRWAGCGDPYRSEPDDEPKVLTPHVTNYLPVVLPWKTFDPAKTRKLYPGKDFTRRNNVLKCRRGVYSEELFEIRRHGALATRGFRG